MTLIRPQTLAVFTLTAIAVWDSSQPSAALSNPVREESTHVEGRPAVATTERAIAQVSLPEAVTAPQFSRELAQVPAAPAKSAQYYQNYQPISPPPEPVSPGVSSTPAQPEPVTSLSEPIWVVPTQPTSSRSSAPQAPPVSVPTPPTAPARPAAPGVPPASPSVQSPDLVVTATEVQILGADAELQQVIRGTIRTQPGGGTSQSQLNQDIAEILDTGLFANASVSSRPNPQGLTIVFQVEPIVVRSLRLSGAQALTSEVANELFKPQLGATVRPSALRDAVQRVNAWYARNGYTLARVLTLQPTREGIVTLEVAEGLIGDIQIRFLNREGKPVDEQGNPIRPRTQEGFVRRQVQLQSGQVFREDIARQDLRRLAELGTFENANVSFEGDARRVTVIYNLVERPSRGFNFGGGYNDDLGIYGTVTYQDTNFGGLAQRLSTNVQVGARDVQFDARFVSPYRATDPATPGYGANISRRQGLSRVFDDDIKLANGSRVREQRIGGGVNLERPLGPDWNGSLGINYAQVSLRDRDGDIAKVDAKGNPLSFSGTGIDDLTSVSFSATRDLRDNVVNPGSGSVLSLSTEQFIPIGRGNIFGNRLQANFAQYFPTDLIKSPNAEQPQVFAFNLQGGTTLGDLPPYNAFVLGGPNSVRGYDTGDVATGRSYFQASAEYRFPIYRFIGGVAFADFATDLGSGDDVLGEPGIQRGKPGSGFGYGLGLRINSPIGIIRADFGINDQGDNRFQFGFGQRF